MIDRRARNIALEALRDFLNGSISNEHYERKYPRSKDDPALWEIWVQVWFFYSDLRTHRLTGRDALDAQGRAFMERCILFLRSSREFEWPRQRIRPWYAILRLIGFSRILKRWDAEEMSIGDLEVWPFLKKSDYEEAARESGIGPHS